MRIQHVLPLALVLALLAGCGSSKSSTTTSATASGGDKVLVGAGSTFVYPLVTSWTGDYNKRSGVTVTYGAIGSGGGIASITDGSVDFGASDAPLSADQAAACKDCVQIPWALGGTSIAYALKGAPAHLNLTGPAIADMFLGKITAWNDPAIAKLNPGVSLPSTRVTPVFRSDSSGTSYNITDYLSRVSPAWKSKVGVSTQPTFPAGQGAKGSSGVSGIVSHTDGAITYVDVAYATTNHLSYAAVQNAAKKYVVPEISSIAASAKAASSPKPNAAVSIVDPPASAADAYPISTFTYAIVRKQGSKAAALKAFLTYAVTDGQKLGAKLLFAPLPPQVVSADKEAIATIG